MQTYYDILKETPSEFDYRREFERLRGAVEQAAACRFESRAANGVLESAVKAYAEIFTERTNNLK